jgi:acetylornithine/succinyldiaminopimelate/putrescine aminotransferase
MMANEKLEEEKRQALAAYARYVNPQKVRVLKNAGLDIIEGRREGAFVWDMNGKRYIDCITSAGSFNVGRRNPEIIAALKQALDQYDLGGFLMCSKPKADLALKRYPDLLVEVRRKGLMMGLQYTNDSIGPRMSSQLARHGVTAIYTGNEPSVMRLMPVLGIQPEEVDQVLD